MLPCLTHHKIFPGVIFVFLFYSGQQLLLLGSCPHTSLLQPPFLSPYLIEFAVVDKSLSHVRLLQPLWTLAYQPPLSMRLPRQEYWSGLPFPSQGIFLTHGSNSGWHWQADSLTWVTREAPHIIYINLLIFHSRTLPFLESFLFFIRWNLFFIFKFY